MNDEVAIRVEHVSKDFVLPHDRVSSLKGAFTNIARTRSGKTKESQHALRDISFEIKKGEFFGIVGRNGSGKSTMLKILAGIYQPTKGKVQTVGKLVPFIELGVGFNPELTGRENVYLNGAMLGFSEKEVAAMYDDIVSFAELEKFMDQKLKNYSSGMQVRLAFSMATRSQADILLIDEVLAVGDADFQRKCFNYFKSLKRDKKTVIFVSHDMDAVREYCDRAVLINDSKLVESGSSSDIATAYTKLFMKQEQGHETATATRWGDQTAAIHKPKVIVKDDTITIEFTVAANQAIDRSILGFSVKDAQDRSIVGTNSRLNQDKPITLAAGKATTVSYSFSNLLNDGEYQVDLAVLDDDGTVKDWWQNAIGITIKKAHHLPAIVNCPVTFTQKASEDV